MIIALSLAVLSVLLAIRTMAYRKSLYHALAVQEQQESDISRLIQDRTAMDQQLRECRAKISALTSTTLELRQQKCTILSDLEGLIDSDASNPELVAGIGAIIHYRFAGGDQEKRPRGSDHAEPC